MTKHTEGPWSVRYTSTQDGKGGHCSVSIYRAAKNIVAKRVQGRLTLEDEANIALIAAAPDMKHELGGIADALNAGETVTIEPGSIKGERILAAIAKAGDTI